MKRDLRLWERIQKPGGPRSFRFALVRICLCLLWAAACGPQEEPPAQEPLAAVGGGGERLVAAARRLVVEGLPSGHHAFNPGLARHRDRLVMVFRVEQHGPSGAILGNRLAAMGLDDDGLPENRWAFLLTPKMVGGADTAEDPRLVVHLGRLWVVYSLSDSDQRMGPRRLHVAELVMDPNQPPATWRLGRDHRLIFVPQGPELRHVGLPHTEKNWSPFVKDDALHFIYRSNPVEVLRLENHDLLGETRDVFPARVEPTSRAKIPWGFGEVRGGTPAIWEPGLGRYVTFFHSRWSCRINGGPHKEHYFTGFYSFHPEAPFDIDRIYSRPLGFPAFVEQAATESPQNIFYVEGAVADGNRYLISYGQGDTALGVLPVDRDALLEGLEDPERLPGPPFLSLELTVDPVCDR